MLRCLLLFVFLNCPSECSYVGDPNSYSRPDLVKTNHLHLDLEVDFDSEQLVGSVVLELERISPEVKGVTLDSKDININSVTDLVSGEFLDWKIESQNEFGEKLEISLPESDLNILTISISYSTSPNSSALQWLSKNMTSGKRHPFLFSQNYPLHGRTMLPCQDSPSVKASYTATITTPVMLTSVMSAVRLGQAVACGKKVSNFIQRVPVPSYLIAIAVGALGRF